MKDKLTQGAVYASAGFTVLILVVIIGFIVIKGAPGINLHFLTSGYEDKTTYVTLALGVPADAVKAGEVPELGVTLHEDEAGELAVTGITSDSPLKTGVNPKGESYPVKKGDQITKAENVDQNTLKLKVVRPGGGIVPMVVTTMYDRVVSFHSGSYKHYGSNLSHRVCKAGPPHVHHPLCHRKPGRNSIHNLRAFWLPLFCESVSASVFYSGGRADSEHYSASHYYHDNRGVSEGGSKDVPGVLSGTWGNQTSDNYKGGAAKCAARNFGGSPAQYRKNRGRISSPPADSRNGCADTGSTLWKFSQRRHIDYKNVYPDEGRNDLTTACAIGIVLLVIIIAINFASKMVTKKLLQKKGA